LFRRRSSSKSIQKSGSGKELRITIFHSSLIDHGTFRRNLESEISEVRTTGRNALTNGVNGPSRRFGVMPAGDCD
jgi:hypothetical protein